MTTTCNSGTNPLNQFLLYTQIAVLKHTFFKTLHTILCIWHNFHEENLVFTRNTLSFKILKSIALLCTLTHHMGKHLSHSFTISNQSFSIKGQQVSSPVLEQWMPTLETEAEPEPEEWESEEDGGGRGRGRPRTVIYDEIRATLVDHEAGKRVQPNLSRYTVASIIRTFPKWE